MREYFLIIYLGVAMIVAQPLLRLLIVSLLFANYGCSAGSNSHIEDKSVRSAAQTGAGAMPSGSKGNETNDLQRLGTLWKSRTERTKISDYPIGPGDVLEISVPAIQELSQRTVRITAEGTISLPFVGVVQAGGLTEEELKEEIRARLAKDYMHDPQLSVYVKEYRSRQVAILGAVGKPGLYNLSSGAESLLDAISLAGGMSNEAASRIHFIAAEPIDRERAKEIAASLPSQLASQNFSPMILTNLDPIVIDLESLARGSHQIYLTVPARPGDVIIVPGRGDVLVQGWVEKAGSYKITPGLTVLGAVAAAGGAAFAGDTSAVKMLRTDRTGEKISLVVDLESIKRGEKPDLPVMEGDVIEVPSSGPMLMVYGFYRFFSSVMHIGASVPLFR